MNIEKSSGPASTSMMRALSCGTVRIVLGEVTRGTARPARRRVSTPVGPPPTTTTFSAPSSMRVGSLSAASQRPSTCSLSRTASGSVYIGKACSAAPSVPKKLTSAPSAEHEVVVRERLHLGELHLALARSTAVTASLWTVALSWSCTRSRSECPTALRLQQAGRELVEERLEGVVVVLVDEHDLRRRPCELLARRRSRRSRRRGRGRAGSASRSPPGSEASSPRGVDDLLATDARPEDVVRPALVEEDERDEDQRHDAHHLQRVVRRRRTVDGEAVREVGARHHHARVEAREERRDDQRSSPSAVIAKARPLRR